MSNPTSDAWDSVIYSWDSYFHFLNENLYLTGSLSLAFIIFLAACVLNSRCWRFLSRHLKNIALAVFLFGVVLYFIGFNDHGSRDNVLALLLRASMSSIEMFVSESDLIEVKHGLHNSPLYMTIFSIVHFMAVFVSGIFILRLFGRRMVSKVHLWIKRFTACRKLYVFWGINEKNMILAESIRRERNDLFVFVNFPDGHHVHSSRFSFSHFFYSSDAVAERYISRIEAMGGLVVAASSRIEDGLVGRVGWVDFYHKLGLSQLGRIMGRYQNTEFFFLSDNADENVEAVSVLKKMAAASRAVSNGKDKFFVSSGNIDIYCHARRNNFTEGILSCPGLEYKVHLVDSSLLSVLQLKGNGDYMKEYGRNHPVNFVDVDTAIGTVSSVFTAMIIGFGETGSDMLRFLYEFSPFVKETRKGADGMDDIVEQKRKIYVIDRHMESFKTKFFDRCPVSRRQRCNRMARWYAGGVSSFLVSLAGNNRRP